MLKILVFVSVYFFTGIVFILLTTWHISVLERKLNEIGVDGKKIRVYLTGLKPATILVLIVGMFAVWPIACIWAILRAEWKFGTLIKTVED